MTFVPTYWDGSDIADCLDASSLMKRQTMPDKRRFAAVLAPTLKGQGKGSGRAEPSDGNGHGLIAFGWNKSACQTLRVGDTTDALTMFAGYLAC